MESQYDSPCVVQTSTMADNSVLLRSWSLFLWICPCALSDLDLVLDLFGAGGKGHSSCDSSHDGRPQEVTEGEDRSRHPLPVCPLLSDCHCPPSLPASPSPSPTAFLVLLPCLPSLFSGSGFSQCRGHTCQESHDWPVLSVRSVKWHHMQQKEDCRLRLTCCLLSSDFWLTHVYRKAFIFTW